MRPALRGVLPGVTERSDVLLWGGGIWDWLDPLTVIRAVATLVERREEVRLVFMGGGRPSAGDDEEMAMAARARTLAGELGVLDRAVVFNDRWVPYGERGDWLVEADIGVSAHFADLETRFAFRTRLLDYLWAGLPIVDHAGGCARRSSSRPTASAAPWASGTSAAGSRRSTCCSRTIRPGSSLRSARGRCASDLRGRGSRAASRSCSPSPVDG